MRKEKALNIPKDLNELRKMGINFARGIKCIGMRTQSKSKIQDRLTTGGHGGSSEEVKIKS